MIGTLMSSRRYEGVREGAMVEEQETAVAEVVIEGLVVTEEREERVFSRAVVLELLLACFPEGRGEKRSPSLLKSALLRRGERAGESIAKASFI